MADHQVIINSQVYKLIPLGFCACECGGKTRVADRDYFAAGQVKGRPLKFINGHNRREIPGESLYNWNGGKRKNNGYSLVQSKGHPRADYWNYVPEHILICEKVLGKPLPEKAKVHHSNGIKDDNQLGNLVICEDHAYHLLLHQRMRAYHACGHANWLKCQYCKQYDDPNNLSIRKNKRQGYHKKCAAERMRIRNHALILARSDNKSL